MGSHMVPRLLHEAGLLQGRAPSPGTLPAPRGLCASPQLPGFPTSGRVLINLSWLRLVRHSAVIN